MEWFVLQALFNLNYANDDRTYHLSKNSATHRIPLSRSHYSAIILQHAVTHFCELFAQQTNFNFAGTCKAKNAMFFARRFHIK